MLATLGTILATLLLAALLCLGAFGALGGAVVAVIATPTDRPVTFPARPAGIACAALGLLIFVAAVPALLDLVAHA